MWFALILHISLMKMRGVINLNIETNSYMLIRPPALAQNIAVRNARKLSYYNVDVTDQKSHAEAVEIILAQARHPLRGAVCCAGITQEIPAIDYPLADFQRILNVNTIGVFTTAQLAARAFRQQKVSGSIVMIASMSGSIANRVRDAFPIPFTEASC